MRGVCRRDIAVNMGSLALPGAPCSPGFVLQMGRKKSSTWVVIRMLDELNSPYLLIQARLERGRQVPGEVLFDSS
jgi:hypothetical protein